MIKSGGSGSCYGESSAAEQQIIYHSSQFCCLNCQQQKTNMQYGYACFYILPHIPDPALMFPPYPYEPALPETPVKIEECEEIEYTNKSNQFLKHFEKELRKTSIKYIKKVWSKEDDRLLLEMRKQNFKWTKISQQIANSNSQICKRRYFRLKQDEEKWPPELQEEIKHVCSTQSLKWEQKMNVLHTKFPQTMNYSKKMIKERYLTYLKESIKQEPWTLEEDMTLIRMLQKGIKRWRTIAQALPGRTELHLKNRYYGCLRSIERKVEKQMQKNNIKHEM